MNTWNLFSVRDWTIYRNKKGDTMSCEHGGCACRAPEGSAVRHEEKKRFLPEGLPVILAGGAVFAAALAVSAQPVRLLLFVAAYLICGGEVLFKAVKNILRGEWMDENFLMSLATVGAFAIGEYPEAVAVMLFYQTGEFFLHWAVHRSRRSVRSLMELQPETVLLRRGEKWEETAPEAVSKGDVFLVRPGERVPLDGVVLKGRSSVDASALTGESVPVEAAAGKELFAGVIALDGELEMQALRPYASSAVAKILELVENASAKKTPTERFITRFARWYTPAVVAAALLTAFVPPLLLADAQLKTWIYRALIFLVISCPCALVLSVPLGFFGGIGAAARRGVLIKGSGSLEGLAKGAIAVFDKTGTLTQGRFEVTGIYPAEGFDKEALLELAAYAESSSTHPLAQAVVKAYDKAIDRARLSDVREKAGLGVSARVDGRDVFAGKADGLGGGIMPPADVPAGTAVFVRVDGKYAGCLALSDTLKPDAARAVADLKKLGFAQTVMLTGDAPEAARRIAEQAGVDHYYASLLPADKVQKVEELLSAKPAAGTLLFAGDGINDAPVLARADVGIAMGALGSDAAIEAADVVLTDDKPSKIPQAVALSRFTVQIVKQNIWFSLLVKAAVMLLGVLGLANLWEAVFADVGVAVLCVLNSLRPLAFKK